MSNRDERGRFVKGHTVRGNSPGRPPRSVEESRLLDFDRVVTGEKWRKIVGKLVAMALKGDFRAIRLLFSYTLGNPIQRIETTMDTTSVIDVKYQQALERVRDVTDG